MSIQMPLEVTHTSWHTFNSHSISTSNGCSEKIQTLNGECVAKWRRKNWHKNTSCNTCGNTHCRRWPTRLACSVIQVPQQAAWLEIEQQPKHIRFYLQYYPYIYPYLYLHRLLHFYKYILPQARQDQQQRRSILDFSVHWFKVYFISLKRRMTKEKKAEAKRKSKNNTNNCKIYTFCNSSEYF